jgi:hypothetical protein
MRLSSKLAWTAVFVACSFPILRAQDLAPRAYVVTPLHSNAVVLTYSYYSGGVLVDGSLPVNNATGTYSVPVFSLYHSFPFFGRSANATASLPYAVGTFQGEIQGQSVQLYRSGLADAQFRLSVNLFGAHAMPLREFARWRQKTLLGASVKVAAPTGQYDSDKLVNWGSNRWSVKPELGYSERWRNWVLDAYAGAWFYTLNPHSFSVPVAEPQRESPIGAFESHLSYDLKPRLWVSFDGNFWFGGVSTLNGIRNPATRQTSSRIGVTASMPLGKHQSVKLSYSDGAYVRFGGNFNNVSVGWQYSWIGHPQ